MVPDCKNVGSREKKESFQFFLATSLINQTVTFLENLVKALS